MRTPIGDEEHDVLNRPLQSQLRAYIEQFLKSTKQFVELRDRVAQLVDDAVAQGSVKIRTAKDVSVLMEAYAKLAEAESKIAASLSQLLKFANERDALTIAIVSAHANEVGFSATSKAFPNQALVPVLPEGDDGGAS